MNTKIKPFFSLIIIIFLIGCALINQAFAEEKAKVPQAVTQKSTDTTRIMISTSGPVKFNSYWIDNPYRLVVEFKSRNIIGNIDKETVVNQGFIKKITASYFNGGKIKALRRLTFELAQKVPYIIWQEENAILLDIQVPLETAGFTVDAKDAAVGIKPRNLAERLEAMDTALKQTQGARAPSEILNIEVSDKPLKDVALRQTGQAQQDRAILTELVKVKMNRMGIICWFIGLVSISALGFALWRKYAVAKTKNLAEKIRELRLQLEEKDKFLGQVEVIRKAIEKAAIEKEEEHEQLKLELQEKSLLFIQEEVMRKEKEKALIELEKGYAQLRETSESLKGVLVRRGIAKELTLPKEKGELWILDKSPERRNTPRLVLTKDFNNTAIVKIELPGATKHIKSFAENISSGGLCFEAKSELDEKNPLNLRLFFYGGKIPNFRTEGWIVWKKTQDSKNYYGIDFEGLSEKVKSELKHYIETNLPPHQ